MWRPASLHLKNIDMDNNVNVVFMGNRIEDHAWVTGEDTAIVHKRLIDEGAFGELFQPKENRSFARKVIHVRGPTMRTLVEKETRILLELHKAGEHPNIIKILGHGWLPSPHSYCYIDMDLCDSNLHDYIYGPRLAVQITEAYLEGNPSPFYTPRECSLLIKLRNTWTIMAHISNGLEFIHANGQVHRDLKPRNVLFSQKEGKWKIADFGISTEATSKHARTTIFASGTPCYRAPELLSETPNYTRKVDIWAMGCILYELLFEKKTFAGDWDVNAYRTSKSLLPIPLITVDEESKVLQSHLSGIIRELLNKNYTKRPRSTDTSMSFRAYSIFFHPSHIQEVLEVSSLPLYREWKEFMVQHPNEVDLLYSVAVIYNRRDAVFLAWVGEVIRRNADVTKELTRRIPSLTRAFVRSPELLRLIGPTDFLRLLGSTEYLRLLGPVDDKFRRNWWTWCALLGEAICGGRNSSVEVAMVKIALLDHLVTGNTQSQSLDLVDRLYSLKLVGASGLVVRLTDYQYFEQHRGLHIAPTDAWRNQSSSPIQTFTIARNIAQNINNDGLYETVARLRKVDVGKIQLWMVSNKVDPIGAKNSAVAEPMLARVDRFGTNALQPWLLKWPTNGVRLYLEHSGETRRLFPNGRPLNPDDRIIFLKQFDPGNGGLRGVQSIYVEGNQKIVDLEFEIKDLMGWGWLGLQDEDELALFKEKRYPYTMDRNLTFAQHHILDGDVVWFWRAQSQDREWREDKPLDRLFRFYLGLHITVNVIFFPKEPIGDLVDFVEEGQGALGAFNCVLKIGMTYTEVTGILAGHIRSLIKPGSKINWEQIKLTPSDLDGMPSSEPLRPEWLTPIFGRLMFNGSDELPPIVFYEITDSLDWASSVKRSGSDESNDMSPAQKRFKLLEESD